MTAVKRRFRYIDGEVVEVTNEEVSVQLVPGLGAYSEARPLVSEGVGCLKAQGPEMREAIRRHGIFGAHVKDNGQIEFTSRKARKEVLAMRGLHDNDGGYGDG